MDEATAYALAERGIVTRDDLAEQAVDELIDIDGIDAERARRADHGGAQALVRVRRQA